MAETVAASQQVNSELRSDTSPPPPPNASAARNRRKLFSGSKGKSISTSLRKVKQKFSSKKRSTLGELHFTSTPQAELPVEPILKQGWVLVRDQWRWRKRYAILFANRLEYFVEKGDREPRGTLLLGRDYTVELSSGRAGSAVGHNGSGLPPDVANGEVSALIKGGISSTNQPTTALKRSGSLARRRSKVTRGKSKKHVFRFKVKQRTLLKLACRDGSDASQWVKLLESARQRDNGNGDPVKNISETNNDEESGMMESTLYFESDNIGYTNVHESRRGNHYADDVMKRDRSSTGGSSTAASRGGSESELDSDMGFQFSVASSLVEDILSRNEWESPLLSVATQRMLKPEIRSIVKRIPIEIIADQIGGEWERITSSPDVRSFESSNKLLTGGRRGAKAFKSECVMHGSSDQVFRLLMDLSDDRKSWDSTFDLGEVLSSIDDRTDVVHVVSNSTSTKSASLFNLPIHVSGRERLMFRYWFRSREGWIKKKGDEDEGDELDSLLNDSEEANIGHSSYVVYYTSVSDPSEYTSRPWGTVFSTVHWSALLIEPIVQEDSGTCKCKVTHATHAEFGGWVEVFSQWTREVWETKLLLDAMERPLQNLRKKLEEYPSLDVAGSEHWDPEDPHAAVDFLNAKSHRNPIRTNQAANKVASFSSGDWETERARISSFTDAPGRITSLGVATSSSLRGASHKRGVGSLASTGARISGRVQSAASNVRSSVVGGKPHSSESPRKVTEVAKNGGDDTLDYVYNVPESTVVVPMKDSPDGRSCWWDSGLEEGFWKIRGPNYLKDRVKVPSQQSAMELLQMQWSFYKTPKEHIALDPDELVQREHIGRSDRPFLFIVNFMVPTIGNYVCYFTRRRGQACGTFDRMLEEFVNGTDKYRDSRFKIIPSVVEGYYIVKRSVGNKPAIIGKKIDTSYFKGENYFEVCVDVGSSKVAKGLMGLVKTYCASLVIDLAFLFESQDPSELPENILGGCRIRYPSMSAKQHAKSQQKKNSKK